MYYLVGAEYFLPEFIHVGVIGRKILRPYSEIHAKQKTNIDNNELY
ncbi:MAG: hypothetical protein Q4D36_01975 [Bacteroidales bacterium]|nr:hypothetical protein [Bacteroidales bacterium]